MPRASTWAEERGQVNDVRPRRWIAATYDGWPYSISDGSLERLGDEAMAVWLWRQGWPVRPCSEACTCGEWSREAARYVVPA